LSDLHNINEIASGNREAFKKLYDGFSQRVFNTALGFVRINEEAEEITQDVFMEIHRSVASFKGDSTVSTWIYRITVNKCLDHIRASKRKKRAAVIFSFFDRNNVQVIDVADAGHPGVALENRENAQLLFQLVDQLVESQRTAFILSQVEDLPQKEIAQVMKISEKAVESLIQRAKANLRNKLEKFYPNRRK
jgi:RNA polymerase sigma factor (sigma-70 family)